MKIGIIIVFNTTETAALKDAYIQTFHRATDVQFCLVDNNCNESFCELLMDIADACENVNVIHIKKPKDNVSAARAGARFMNSRHNSKFLGYIEDLNKSEIIKAIDLFIDNKEEIRTQHMKKQSNKLLKQAFFEKMFSVSNYFKHFDFKLDEKIQLG